MSRHRSPLDPALFLGQLLGVFAAVLLAGVACGGTEPFEDPDLSPTLTFDPVASPVEATAMPADPEGLPAGQAEQLWSCQATCPDGYLPTQIFRDGGCASGFKLDCLRHPEEGWYEICGDRCWPGDERSGGRDSAITCAGGPESFCRVP